MRWWYSYSVAYSETTHEIIVNSTCHRCIPYEWNSGKLLLTDFEEALVTRKRLFCKVLILEITRGCVSDTRMLLYCRMCSYVDRWLYLYAREYLACIDNTIIWLDSSKLLALQLKTNNIMHLSMLSATSLVRGGWGFDLVESLIPQPADKLLGQILIYNPPYDVGITLKGFDTWKTCHKSKLFNACSNSQPSGTFLTSNPFLKPNIARTGGLT